MPRSPAPARGVRRSAEQEGGKPSATGLQGEGLLSSAVPRREAGNATAVTGRISNHVFLVAQQQQKTAAFLQPPYR